MNDDDKSVEVLENEKKKEEESISKEEKTSQGSNALIYVLVGIMILGIIAVIVLAFAFPKDKSSLDDKKQTEETTKNDEEKKDSDSLAETLDITSRLVTSLYNKVKSHQHSCASSWIFGSEEFDVDSSDEKIRMRVVSNNLTEGARIRFNCNNLGAPQAIVNKIPSTIGNEKSACQWNKEYGTDYFEEFGYESDYVKSLYKELFGSDKELDLSMNIPIMASSIGNLIYVKDLDMYVFYPMVTGLICADSDSFELVEAKKNGNLIQLYENYLHITKYNDDGTSEKENLKFVYTFRYDKDGIYSFVSRKKVH